MSSSFDPDSSIGSLKKNLLDTEKLPELRDSAKKYKYPRSQMPEPDFTDSQLRTTFPDFTQGLSASEDSYSIEKARSGLNDNAAGNRDFSSTGFNSIGSGRKARAAATSIGMGQSPSNDLTPLPQPLRYTSAVQKPLAIGETRFSADFSDMPNMSELVSGVFENGTPLFSKLASRSKDQPKFQHAVVNKVPAPNEEQEILMSLKLLKEKVAQLEVNKVEDANIIEALRAKNEVLAREKAQLARSRRSDSAYGSSGSEGGEERNIGFRRAAIEKLRLETNVRDLQEQLEEANERYNSSASAIKDVAQERDQAVNQLGVAYITIQSLHKEIETLSAKNEELFATANELHDQLEAVRYRYEPEFRATSNQASVTSKSVPSTRATVIKHNTSKPSSKKHTKTSSEPFSVKSSGDDAVDVTCLSKDSLDLFPEIREMLEQSRIKKRPDRAGATAPTPVHAARDQTVRSNVSTEFHPPSEMSLLEQRSTRQGIPKEDLTSAFILPDITLGNTSLANSTAQVTAPETIEKLVKHDLDKCNICQRLMEPSKPHSHKKNTRTIPKPVPVSERMPSPTPSDEDPTMRPSQSPGVALARVIRDLEDECKHLKIVLKKHEDLSHQQIPALSRSKRARLETKIGRLRAEISSKSDQIYALYDVLEGQKQAGQEMSQLEVEITLQDIGIDTSRLDLGDDTSRLNLRGGHVDNNTSTQGNTTISVKEPKENVPLRSALKRPSSKHAWDNLSDNNSLPWEGFDSTADNDHTGSTRHSYKLRGRF